MLDKKFHSCQVVCYAEYFDFKALSDVLLGPDRETRYRNVFFLQLEQGGCAVFPFGVVVYWNLQKDAIERIEEEVRRFSKGAPVDAEVEYYPYIDGCEKNRFWQDQIELTDSEPLTLLAISHALAQSIKLSVFESQAEKTIETTSAIPRRLAQTGSTLLSRRQTAKMRGQLFVTKSEILLKYELLDTPEFFWEYPELEPIYQVGAYYLEIKQRTRILSLKLEAIHELFEMLADDLKHKHSSMLEWIIIWLIAVEIIMFLVNDVILAHARAFTG